MKKILPVIICCLMLTLTACVKSVDETPDSITLNYTDLQLQVGSGKQLLARKYDATQITWSSSDNTVASIDDKGVIVALKVGQTTMTAKSKQYNITATCLVIVSPMVIEGKDIGIGADGSIFIVNTDVTPNSSGYSISKLVNNTLTPLPDCGAVRVAVSPTGVPWVVTKAHKILKFNGTGWDELPGRATDIAIGGNGGVFAIGDIETSVTGGNNIMKWTGTAWEDMLDCAAIRIAVTPAGIPWVVNKSGLVYKFGGTYLWSVMDNVTASDIGIGADGSIFVTGKSNGGTNPDIFKFDGFYNWNNIGVSGGANISVTPDGKAWWIDTANVVHHQ